MAGGRPTRRSAAVANENDENLASTRSVMTRAKTATLNTAAPAARRRAALGDVSNVTKGEGVEGKKVAGKTVLASKAGQPTRVQKASATTVSSARPALSVKNANKPVGAKREKSGAGTIAVNKRKVPSAGAVVGADPLNDDRERSRKRIHVEPPKTKPSESEAAEEAPLEEPVDDEIIAFERTAVPTSGFPKGVRDLDTEDLDDPLMVAEYTHEIFEYLRELEEKTRANPHYMDHQDDLEWKTRGILIDWLVEVHTRFHLLPETLFLTVNIIDRFLSEKVVQLDRLQLVGITAMFIASKYEEVLSPHVSNFKHVADDGFTELEILSAERCVLETLDYDLGYPNPMNFLRRISKADNYDIQSRTIAKYLMEISLLDHRFMTYRPSHIAAGAMYLSRLILGRGDWDKTLSFYSGYEEEEIEPVVQLMVDYLARPMIHDAFFKKYASKKFMKASILSRGWAKANAHHFEIEDLYLTLDQISS